MSLTKDGFYKSFSGAIGNNNYLLEAGGGHIGWGNAANQIPYSNGTVNSNLNADMVDGLHVHGGRNNEANKIVRTDGSGYIQAGWINTTSGDMGSTAFSRIYVSNDAYIRYVSVAKFKTGLFGGQVGSPSVPIYWTGSAFATCIVSFGNSSYGEHNANNINDNGIKYYNSNGPSTSLGATTSDGALYSQAYNTSWVGQIAQDYRNGGLYVRGKNNGTWQSWYRVWDNRTTYVSGGKGYIGSTEITQVNNADTVDGHHQDHLLPYRYTYGAQTNSGSANWYVRIQTASYISEDCTIYVRGTGNNTSSDLVIHVLCRENRFWGWETSYNGVRINGIAKETGAPEIIYLRMPSSTTSITFKSTHSLTIDKADYSSKSYMSLGEGLFANYIYGRIQNADYADTLTNPGKYYWANIPMQTSSDSTKQPTFGRTNITYAATNGTSALQVNIGSTNYAYGVDIQSSIAAGNTAVSLLAGVNHATNNQLSGLFYYAGNNSTSNRFGFGFYGNDNILNIRADKRVGICTTAPAYTLDVTGTIRATSRIYANEWIEFSQAYTGLYWPNGNNASHFHPNDATTYGQFVLRGSRGGYSGITLARDANYMTIMDNSQDKGLYQQTGGIWIIYYRRDASRVGIRTSSDFGANININGTTHIRYSTLDNTAFKNILTIFGNNSNESSSESFTEGNASWGIGFQRQWSSGTATGICAGIFCVPSGSWRAGLAFRVKNNTTASNGAHDVTAIFISPKGSLLQQNYNNWLSPARTQIGRLDSSTYNDRSIIGTTNGNLHIDPYYNANAGTYSTYINYYSNAGYTYFNGGTYRITNGGHTYFAGYHFVGNDNNNYVLLAGGSYKQWTTNNTANALVARDGNGYVYAAYYNSAISAEDFTIATVYCSHDNWIRKMAFSTFTTKLLSQFGITTDTRRSKNSSNTNIESVTGYVLKNKSFIDIWGFAPTATYRTTKDRPAPYGIGFTDGSDSGGIMPVGDSNALKEIRFYGANSGPTHFTFGRMNWESTSYDSDNSNSFSLYTDIDGTNGNIWTSGSVAIGTSSFSQKLRVYGGIVRIERTDGIYVLIGPQNSSHCHYETNAGTSHWFNKRVDVNGAIWRYNTNYGIADDGRFYALAMYANRSANSTDGGVSLYSNDFTYALMFRGTGNRGKWGDVQSDWATYSTMNNTAQRGWIWQSGTAEANMSAALSVRGVFATRAVGNNAGYLAFPQNNSYYTSTATVTGALKIILPRYQTNCMLMFDVNIFTYDEGTSNIVTYRIGGYEYGSTGWYAPVSKVFSFGRGDKVNLSVRFGYDGSKTCVTIGETNTTWKYPQVSITNVTYGYSDVAISSWGYGWSISFTTTLPSSVSTTFTDPYFNGMYWANQRVRPNSSTTTTPQFGKVMINTTSTTYQLNIGGDSYATGWSRAGSGFYCEGNGVHYTHLGSYGEIYLSGNNVFNFTTGSWSTLYFNYGGSGKVGGTWVSNYVWHAGSSSTYADHNIGKLHVRPTSGNYSWNEGIRLHPASNGWTTLTLCGTDNTGDTGTSANTWSLHAYGGNFYLSKNGSTGGTSYMDNISNKWYFNTTSGGEAVNVGGWINTVGACGWYNSTYGGGMWMNDSTYVRVYNGKYLYTTYIYYDVGNQDYTLDHIYASNDRYIRPMAIGTFLNKLWWANLHVSTSSNTWTEPTLGRIYVQPHQGSWVSGMTTNPSIWYNNSNAIDASSYWAFLGMKSSSSHVINFGGLGNNIGFLGYYAGRTANSYDWYFWCNTANGQWTASARLNAPGFYHTSYGSATYLLRSDGGVAAFNWSGQSGQPSWLWGGNSQHSYYLYNPSNFSVNYANYAGYAHKLDIYGYNTDGLSFYQTSSSFQRSDSSWAHYIIANHGNGSTYYNYILRLPFWGPPQYARKENGTNTSWYTFFTTENGYWADQRLQTSSNAYTVPSFAAIKIRNSSPAYHSADNIISGTAGEIYFAGNFHIDSRGSNKLYLNHYTSNSIAMVTGGGNVGIGTDSPSYGLTLAVNKRLYIEGNESNPIYTEYHPNSHISTNSPESNAAIRHGFVFKWYNTYWKIGNVRGGASNSAGFGIAYSGGAQLQLLVRPGSKTWIYYGIHTFTSSQSWGNNPESGNNGISIKSINGGGVMTPYIHFVPNNISKAWRFATYYTGSGYGYENNLILYQGYTSQSYTTLAEYIFRGQSYGSQGKCYVATCEGNSYNLVVIGVFTLTRSSPSNSSYSVYQVHGLITPVIVNQVRNEWLGSHHTSDGGMIIRMDMRSGYENYTTKTTINIVSAYGIITETWWDGHRYVGLSRDDVDAHYGSLGSFDIAIFASQPSQFTTNDYRYSQTNGVNTTGRYLMITNRTIAGWNSNGGIGRMSFAGLYVNSDGACITFKVTCFGYLS